MQRLSMPHRSFASVLFLPLVAAFAPPGRQSARAQASRVSGAEIARAVDSLAQRVVAEGVSPAIGIALVVDGHTLLATSYGMADATNRVPAGDRTLWYVASTSKSFTGFGASLLASQARLAFDVPIRTLIPTAAWNSAVDPSRLTLAHFLSHTHSLSGNAVVLASSFTGAVPEAQWPQLIRFMPPASTSDLVYSNFGYNVVAMAIDAARPEGWRRYLDSAVFRPAGMTDTYARLSGLDPKRLAMTHQLRGDGSYVAVPMNKTDATMSPAGGHVATMSDLAKWLIVQMNEGEIEGRRVFDAEVAKLSHRLIARHTVAASRRFAFFDREGWAAGWDIGAYEGERMVSRFGSYSSMRSHLSFLPDRRVGVAAVVNGRLAYSLTDVLAALAYDLDAGRPRAREIAEERLRAVLRTRPDAIRDAAAADALRSARAKPLPKPLASYVGSYYNDKYGTISFEVIENRLNYRWGVLLAPAETFDATAQQVSVEVGGNPQVASFDFGAGEMTARSIRLLQETFIRY